MMEEEEENEMMLRDYPKIIPYESSIKIKEQMENNICRFNIDKNGTGTGFFCKIPFPTEENLLPVFITNNHLINRDLISKKDVEIEIYIKSEGNVKKINLDNRMKYTNEEYDITIIELKKEDNINNYLELDDRIINSIINGHDYYSYDETIYIIQYPRGELSVSYGVLSQIMEDKKYNFYHKCDTYYGSSGSPILNINNNKVFGIHKRKARYHNIGTFLNGAIKEFILLNGKIDANKNIYKHQINETLLTEFNKIFSKDIKDIKIEFSHIVKNTIGEKGHKELNDLIFDYNQQHQKEFLDLNFHEKIIEQMEKDICKIIINKKGTGFFCKIPFPTEENLLPVLITNNYLINRDLLNKKNVKIEIYIKSRGKVKQINLDNRMKYTNEEYDITIIELKNEDNINNYLELDNTIINSIINNKNNNMAYLNESIYITEYQEKDLSISYGIITSIDRNNACYFEHACYSHMGSSGSPILNINNKVIGIHKDIEEEYERNKRGTFLNYPIKEFIEKNNCKKIISIPVRANASNEKYGLLKHLFGGAIFNELNKIFLNFKLKYSWEETNFFFTLEFTKKLFEGMEKYVFSIEIGGEQCTGFFCKIPFPKVENLLPVFITNNHLINRDLISKKDVKIEIYIKSEGNVKKINLDNRMKYTNEEYDITIIELKKEDNINNYLELDDTIINSIINNKNNNKDYTDSKICIVQYFERNVYVSYGIIKKIYEDKTYNFQHKCSTKEGSFGSPIININNKVLGLSVKGDIDNQIYRGTFLNYPIKEFIKINYNNN